jgi:hypothetical protein
VLAAVGVDPAFEEVERLHVPAVLAKPVDDLEGCQEFEQPRVICCDQARVLDGVADGLAIELFDQGDQLVVGGQDGRVAVPGAAVRIRATERAVGGTRSNG